MLERETLIFWIAAQRIRLTPPDSMDDVDEALDDIVAIHCHTESETLAQRCADLLDGELARCEYSA